MNKIFITGSTGFVGTNLTEYLTNHNYEIVGVSRIKNDETKTINYLDFQAQLKLGGKAVIHLAGKAHDLKKVSKPEEYYEVNFELVKRVFNDFLKSNASTFIFLSTIKAVADKVEGVLTEDSFPNPKTHYGIAKLKAEKYILSQELPHGKQVYILRPCMIHGPGNKGNLNLLYQLVSKGLPWPLGDFDNQRSFCSIENLCFVIKELLSQNDILSGIYNVADDTSLSTNELIQLIAASHNKRAKILRIPKGLILHIAKLGDVLHLPLNSERLQKLTENYLVENMKIKQVLGMEKMPIKAQEGLEKTIKYFTNKK